MLDEPFHISDFGEIVFPIDGAKNDKYENFLDVQNGGAWKGEAKKDNGSNLSEYTINGGSV